MPSRIRLSRAKGWRMPPHTMKVDRSTRWGNPFRSSERAMDGAASVTLASGLEWMPDSWWTDADVVAMFEQWMTGAQIVDAETGVPLRADVLELIGAPPAIEPLRAKDLACWCEPGAPCHADVLIALANRSDS